LVPARARRRAHPPRDPPAGRHRLAADRDRVRHRLRVAAALQHPVPPRAAHDALGVAPPDKVTVVDVALRNLTYRRFVQLGRAPLPEELGDRDEVLAGWRALEA